ncbi:MAG: hypothetical protein HY719_07875 [Planctomycetes bacterium]|nr:hypothetical protein [Planctomycetota bacterium]
MSADGVFLKEVLRGQVLAEEKRYAEALETWRQAAADPGLDAAQRAYLEALIAVLRPAAEAGATAS